MQQCFVPCTNNGCPHVFFVVLFNVFGIFLECCWYVQLIYICYLVKSVVMAVHAFRLLSHGLRQPVESMLRYIRGMADEESDMD